MAISVANRDMYNRGLLERTSEKRKREAISGRLTVRRLTMSNGSNVPISVTIANGHVAIAGTATGTPPIPLPNQVKAGIFGTSDDGTGVYGSSHTGPGVKGESVGDLLNPHGLSDGVLGVSGGDGVHGQGGRNGVVGRTSSGSDSGVWGDNTGSGVGVAGNSNGGDGIHGTGGRNGVVGRTSSGSDSGVWADNTGAGAGVAGTSASGVGVYGRGGRLAGQFDGNVVINGGNLTMQNGGDVILADFAEDFRSLEMGVVPGTVMVIDDSAALRPCDVPYDKRVAGVVSGAGNFRPAIILGNEVSED
jgi:hypothetical protein